MSQCQVKPSIWRSKDKIGKWHFLPLPESSFLGTIQRKLKEFVDKDVTTEDKDVTTEDKDVTTEDKMSSPSPRRIWLRKVE